MEIILSLGWLVWSIAIISFLLLAYASSSEEPIAFLAVAVVAGIALLYATGHNLTQAWVFTMQNPGTILRWFATYLGIGVLYATSLWYMFLRNIRHKLNDFRAARDAYRNNSEPLSQRDRDQFRSSCNITNFPPRVSDHKRMIVSNIILWSFCWVEVRPLTKLVNFIYGSISGALQSMSDRMFKGTAY